MDMILGSPGASERRKNDTVQEGHSTDFERSEESREANLSRDLKWGWKLERVCWSLTYRPPTLYIPGIPHRYV